MAREKYEIKDSMLSQLTGLELSASLVAIWNMIVDAVVSAIYVFEKIIDAFKLDIEKQIALKRIGSLSWYINLTKAFQLNDNVVFFEDGTVGYQKIDVEKQIVAYATATEASDIVNIKVAKLDNSELVPLTEEELLQLKSYLDKTKVIGTVLNLVSLIADKIKVVANIYYDPIYSQLEIQGFLDAALFTYKTTKTDSLFNKNDFIEVLRDVTGIVDVGITTLQGIQGTNTTDIDREYEVVAGYFNWDETNVYNLI
ncbi:MAG: hypothetical protein JXA16_01065 [Bacteroidales bacterium]|nr:hypothetical protein [Bacteroidales bacterium]